MQSATRTAFMAVSVPALSGGQEQPHELIVDDLALSTHREVRGDHPLSAAQLAVAPRHLPHDGAALKSRDGCRSQHSAAYRAKGERAEGAVADAPRLHE